LHARKESIDQLPLLQVATTKASGEQVKLSLPLASIPHPNHLRDPQDYDWEQQEQDLAIDRSVDGDADGVPEVPTPQPKPSTGLTVRAPHAIS
jgi:hypothetical protein